jgi:hypothetical protein
MKVKRELLGRVKGDENRGRRKGRRKSDRGVNSVKVHHIHLLKCLCGKLLCAI